MGKSKMPVVLNEGSQLSAASSVSSNGEFAISCLRDFSVCPYNAWHDDGQGKCVNQGPGFCGFFSKSLSDTQKEDLAWRCGAAFPCLTKCKKEKIERKHEKSGQSVHARSAFAPCPIGWTFRRMFIQRDKEIFAPIPQNSAQGSKSLNQGPQVSAQDSNHSSGSKKNNTGS